MGGGKGRYSKRVDGVRSLRMRTFVSIGIKLFARERESFKL